MADTISNLNVIFRLTADEFISGARAIQRECTELEKTVKPLKETLKDVGAPLLAAGTALVGTFTALTKAAANYGDELLQAKQRTGLTVEELSKLRYAAEQNDATFADLSTGLARLARNASEAAQGSKEQAAAFKALNVEVVDASGKMRPLNDIVLDVSDRFKKMPDGIDKTAASIDLLGRGGTALIPTLSLGSEGLEEMGDKAARLHKVISEDAAVSADKFNDTLDDVKAATLGLAIEVADALLPALTDFAEIVVSGITAAAQFAQEHQGLTKAALALGLALTAAGGVLVGLAGFLTVLGPLTVAVTTITGAVAFLGTGLVALGAGPIAVVMAALVALTFKIADATGLIDKLALKIAEWTGANEAAVDANKATEAATAKLADTLKTKYNIEIVRGTRSLNDWNTEVVETLRKHASVKVAIDKTTDSTETYTDKLRAQKEAEEAAKKAMENRKKAAEQLADALRLAYRTADTASREAMASMKAEGDNAINYWTKIYLAQLDAKIDALDVIDKALSRNREKLDSHLEGVANDSRRWLDVMTDDYIKGVNQRIKLLDDLVEASKMAQQRAVEDVKRSAGEIFDSMFLKGESVFATLGNALKGGALSLGRAIFEDIVGTLLGPIKKAFDDFFQGLLEGIGLKNFISGLGQKLGDALSGLFGGGTSGAAGTVGAAGQAAGGTGGIGGAATGALGGIVGGIISGIGSFLGSMRLEGTMNAVEANTRFTYILIRDFIDHIGWALLRRSEDILAELYNHKYLPDLVETLGNQTIAAIHELTQAVGDSARSISTSIAAAISSLADSTEPETTKLAVSTAGVTSTSSTPAIFGGAFIPAYERGISFVPKTGPALLHQGEAVIARDQNRMPSAIHVHIHGGMIDRATAREIGGVLKEEIFHGAMSWPATENIRRQKL